MEEYPVDPKVRGIWKIYPVRVLGRSISDCCGEPTLLVQSMEGGFVTRNCSRCGQYTTLPERVFKNEIDLWVACPKCKGRMKPEVLPDKNYGFVCTPCDICIKLSDLLPRWEDL